MTQGPSSSASGPPPWPCFFLHFPSYSAIPHCLQEAHTSPSHWHGVWLCDLLGQEHKSWSDVNDFWADTKCHIFVLSCSLFSHSHKWAQYYPRKRLFLKPPKSLRMKTETEQNHNWFALDTQHKWEINLESHRNLGVICYFASADHYGTFDPPYPLYPTSILSA